MNSNDSRVLVVDDMSTMRKMIKAVLVETGIENIREASDGEKAADLLKSNGFDLVICDWDMPRMNGLELLQHVRADERTQKLPFIMLTANAKRDDVTQAIKSGVSDYLAKPFKPDDLVAKLERVWRS